MALLANVVTHAVAMGAMALLLIPMMPGGTTADPMLRMQMISDQTWRFRLGWLTTGVELARQGDVAAYLAFERAGLQSAAIRRVAWLTWPLMLVVTVATLTVTPTPLASRLISTGNGIGFTLMMIWLIGLTRAARAAWREEEAPRPAAPRPAAPRPPGG